MIVHELVPRRCLTCKSLDAIILDDDIIETWTWIIRDHGCVGPFCCEPCYADWLKWPGDVRMVAVFGTIFAAVGDIARANDCHHDLDDLYPAYSLDPLHWLEPLLRVEERIPCEMSTK
ncbi:MAG: hypothetical protein NVSMB52_20410 [Chloroflexota bacterium]